MRSVTLFCTVLAPLLFALGCPAPDLAPCGDAPHWASTPDTWPTDALFIGDERVEQQEAVELLVLPPVTGADALAAALVVAELNLAAGSLEGDLPTVYAAHAWFADHDASDRLAEDEAFALAEAVHASQACI